MAQTVYKRQLVGQQSGVQVNMPRDTVERLLQEAGDQTFAAVGKFSRGRIDKPFLVSASKMVRYLGKPKSVRADAAAETYVQMFEAFSTGAAAAVVVRLASDAAKNKWVVVSGGAENEITVADAVPAAGSGSWIAAFKFADCINEGMYFSVKKGENSRELAVTVRERNKNHLGNDDNEGEILYEFAGSTDADAKDDVGESNYIADVAAKFYGDWVEVLTNGNAEIQSADTLNSREVSSVVETYTDTGTIANADYQKAAKSLGNTTLQYLYIMGDSANTSLTASLLDVAQKYNRSMRQEIPGNLNPEAAVNWKNTFQYDAQGGMYCLWIWSPIKRNDPTGSAGVYRFGTVGQKIGRACARNAVINNFGLPALNQPIAGKDYFLTGTRIEQTYFPDDVELAALAKAHINPVQYVEYHDGSGFVWDDSLSGAKKNGISRLENAAEISQWLQERFGRYARSLLQKPMTEAVRAMTRFAEDTLQACEASGWLTPSAKLGGAAYSHVIQPSERNPEDEMTVTLNIAIDGVVRRIFVSQNMYSRS